MRIQLWTIYYDPEPMGIAPLAGVWARGMAERGHEVEVITAHPHYPTPQWGRPPLKPYRGKIATVRPNGRPHVVPIWFALDGDSLIFTTWHTSVKAKNLRHSPWISLTVDDETPPYTVKAIRELSQRVTRED